jgi:hypothetical protein
MTKTEMSYGQGPRGSMADVMGHHLLDLRREAAEPIRSARPYWQHHRDGDNSNMGKLCLLLFYLGRCLIRNKWRVSSLQATKALLVLQTGGGLQRIHGAVTTRCYPRSRMQGASTINLSLSTTPTLVINTLLPLE